VAGEEAMPRVRHHTADRTVSARAQLDAIGTRVRVGEDQTLDRVLPPPERCDSEVVIPLLGEEVAVTRQVVETGRVAVARVTREHSELIAEPLATETVEISRVPIGRQVDQMPAVREEGDTVVIPVVEERLLVERHLFLMEEVRVRRVRTASTHQENVILRHHEVTVNRHPGAGVRQQAPAAGGTDQPPFISTLSPTGEGK
jgi:uncharacterized protein (TIGR02271 family)